MKKFRIILMIVLAFMLVFALCACNHEHQYTTKVEKEATCTEAGLSYDECELCHDRTNEKEIPALGHKLAKIEARPATCVQDGVKEHYACELCNEKFTDETCSVKYENGEERIAKLGHLGDEKHRCEYLQDGEHEYYCERIDCPGTLREKCPGTWNKLFDCTKGGNISHKCDICGNTETKHLEASEYHNWDEWQVEYSATCTESGSKIRYCKDCIQTETDELKPTGHTLDSGTVTKAATCSDTGEMTYYCLVCRQKCATVPIQATGAHIKDAGKITREPTCSQEGEKIYHCSVCNHYLSSEKIDKLPHTPDGGHITKEATCAAAGIRTYYCTVCKGVAQTEEIPATKNHVRDAGQITREPTCSQEGEKIYTCNVCKCYLGSESLRKLPHTLDSGTATDNPPCVEGRITFCCLVCKQVCDVKTIPPTKDHKEDEGTITEPTCTAEGEIVYRCEACNIEMRRKVLEKIPHTYTISEKYWLEPGYVGPTPDHPATIQYSCEQCHQQFVESYDKNHFVELGLEDKIFIEDKYSADTVVMYDGKQGCLAINLLLQSLDLSVLSDYSNIFDTSSKILTIPVTYGDRNDSVKSVRLIGPAAALNEFAITTKNINTLKLTLRNITFTAKSGVALDLSNVENAELEILGSVTINGATGQDAIHAQDLSIYGDDMLTINGGNGNNGNSSAGGNGGVGIIAKNVSIYMSGLITIKGGNGGNGSNGAAGKAGNVGGNGGSAVNCASFAILDEKAVVKSDLSKLYLISGSGGNGGNGGQGSNNGNTAGTGGAGGNGGNGGEASDVLVITNQFVFDTCGNVLVQCGNGGNGGKGGQGGQGGKGKEGRDAYKGNGFFGAGYHGGDDGGTGGVGGAGGNGGNGGKGGQPIVGAELDERIFVQYSKYGVGGDGGKGGKGGTGGDGGSCDGRVVGSGCTPGGNGGKGGKGGKGGTGGSGSKAGAAGAGGDGGSGGIHKKTLISCDCKGSLGSGAPGDPGAPGKEVA